MSGQINISAPAKTYITDRHRLRIHPLPPPIIGHLTGLTCPECPLNSTSQLRYHPPAFQTRQTSTGSVTNPTLTTEMERVTLELSNSTFN
ncbi:hypothetical protein H4Q26_014953 [Puccinia striiformis f. sp. tritici PST-130]|nr:hypothetical protein H4Q26_014953 [Puccinia striiformis f. sp. tritici PST-130]